MYQYQTRADTFIPIPAVYVCIWQFFKNLFKIILQNVVQVTEHLWKKINKNQNNSIMCTGFIKYSILASTKMQVYSTGIGASLICAF